MGRHRGCPGFIAAAVEDIGNGSIRGGVGGQAAVPLLVGEQIGLPHGVPAQESPLGVLRNGYAKGITHLVALQGGIGTDEAYRTGNNADPHIHGIRV